MRESKADRRHSEGGHATQSNAGAAPGKSTQVDRHTSGATPDASAVGAPVGHAVSGAGVHDAAASQPAAQPAAASSYTLGQDLNVPKLDLGAKSTLPDPTRAKMEQSFGQSFADVGIHENSGKASGSVHAVTDGSDVHFAAGKYAPGTGQGDHLIAHELAHVVQQRSGHGAGVQNFEEGVARGLLEVDADRAADRAAAGQPANVRFRATPASRQMYDSWEHKQLGDDGGGGRTITTKSGVTLTYGDAVALSGDFYPSADALMNAPADELHTILDQIHQQQTQAAANGGKPTEDQEAAHDKAFENATMWRQRTAYGSWGAKTGQTKGEQAGVGSQSYLDLAGNNNLHFSPDNIKNAWKPEHRKAMDLALQQFQKHGAGTLAAAPGVSHPKWEDAASAGHKKGVEAGPEATPGATKPAKDAHALSANDLMGQALFHDTFACHFLTDSFASGHLVSGVKGRSVGGAFWSTHSAACTAALKSAANADYPHTPHQVVDYAVNKLVASDMFQGKVASLCLKLVHDKLNDTPIVVTNLAGDSWPTRGDQALSKAPETQRIAAQAVQASRQAVEEMANTGKCAQPERALDYIPVTASLAGSAARPIDTFATDPAMFTALLAPLLLDASIKNPLYQLIKSNLGLGSTFAKEWAGEKVNEVEHGIERGAAKVGHGIKAAGGAVKDGVESAGHKVAHWVKSLF